jgi:hypothetical protein
MFGVPVIHDAPQRPGGGCAADARHRQAEPQAALAMLGEVPAAARTTVGSDKAYDTAAFVAAARELKVTPHVAQNINAHRGSNVDARTTRHPGYQISQVIRKRIEEANGWIKTVAGMAQTKFRGLARVGWMFQFRAAAYNLIRLPGLNPRFHSGTQAQYGFFSSLLGKGNCITMPDATGLNQVRDPKPV